MHPTYQAIVILTFSQFQWLLNYYPMCNRLNGRDLGRYIPKPPIAQWLGCLSKRWETLVEIPAPLQVEEGIKTEVSHTASERYNYWVES